MEINLTVCWKSCLGLVTDGTWGLRKTEALKFILVIEIDILKEDSKTGGITVLPTLSGLENLKNDDAMDKKRIIIIF